MGRLVVTSSVADVRALLPAGVTTATHMLLVGGGGGGGRAGSSGGGGGAGEIVYETDVALSGTMPCTIGAGGAGRTGSTGAGENGGASTFAGFTAAGGGGGGGGGSAQGRDGACGGGAPAAGSFTPGVGSVGGDGGVGSAPDDNQRYCGGGGGMGGNGQDGSSANGGGDGGPGVDYSTIFGSDVGAAGWFAGGGGGGTRLSGSAGGAGQAGGGNGGSSNQNATAAAANTGSGGGGSGSTTAGANIGDGGNGAAGVLILMYEDPPDDPTIPAIIEGATAEDLTNPTGRAGMGKGQHWQWWNTVEGRWDAVLPTTTGWRLFTDLLGTPATGTVVDDRQDTRIDTLWYDGSLWVLRGHDTTTRVTKYDYTSGTYVADPNVTDVTVSVPITGNGDSTPLLLHRTPNGRLWVAAGTAGFGGAALVSFSDDDGASWTFGYVVVPDATGVAMLTDAEGLLILVVMLNDGAGRAVFTLDQGSLAVGPDAWATETLPALPSGLTSDDHGMAINVDGHVYATAKTTGSTTSGQPLLYLLHRAPGGTWTQHQLRPGPDNQGDTRPVLVAHGDTLYVGYGRNQNPTDGMRVTVPRSTLTPGTPGVLLDSDDGRWSDSYAVPREVSGESGLLWIAHDTDTGLIWRVWEALPHLADASLGVTLGITATAVKRAAGAAPLNLNLATADTGDKAGQSAADVGVDVTAEAEATKTGTGAATMGVNLVTESAGTKHTVASATMELALAITAATQLGAEAALGVDLGIAATATKHTSAGAAFDLQLSTSDLAEKAADADAQLAVALGLLASAVRGGTHRAELGLDLDAAATAAKHAAAYATITLGLTVETVAAKQAIADAAFHLAVAVAASTGDPEARDITILSAEIVPSPWRGELVPSAWSAEVVS